MELEIKKAAACDIQAVAALYSSLIGTQGCTWNEYYPTAEDVSHDVAAGALYIASDGDGRIIAAVAAGEHDETDGLGCWSRDMIRPLGISRLGVSADHQGRGIARRLMLFLEDTARSLGFDGAHFLVSPKNLRALRLYGSLGYVNAGSARMFEQDWYCYEKKL